MQFTYKATNKEGRSVTGTADVADRKALLALLNKQGLHPVVVQKSKGKGALGNIFKPAEKVKLNDLVIFTRQLSTMISAGVPLNRCLSALQSNTQNPYFKTVIAIIAKDVESGQSLGDAFAKHPKAFSDVYINMVKAGEEGGILDEILKRLATQVEQDASIKKRVKSAMMYPIVILIITILAFFGIMLFIMPKMETVFSSVGGPGYKLPVYTRVLLQMSQLCTGSSIVPHVPNLIFIAIVFGVGVFFLMRYIQTPKGKFKFHLLLLKTPIVKDVILKVAVARFSRTFAALMGAGVSVLDSLEVTGAALGNKVIEKELVDAADEVRNGKPLSQPISRSPYFPQIVSQMLAVGEETGQIDTVLTKIADFYEEEVTVLIDGLAAIIEPVMIVFLGAGVGLIAASVMGPIANLSKSIGSGGS